MKSFKEKAVFAEWNKDLVRGYITSKGDIGKLASLPPYFLVMDLTYRCNYRCIGCVDMNAVNHKNLDMPIELIESLFEYSNKKKLQGIMTMGGESFSYKEGIRKAMEKSRQFQIPLKTVTNGSLLEKFVDEISETYTITGSILRVSINATMKEYPTQVGRKNSDLKQILNSIERINLNGVGVMVSTVVFPQESQEYGFNPNIDDIEEIIKYCEDSGVKTHILLRAREPKTKRKLKYTKEEEEFLRDIEKREYDLELFMDHLFEKNEERYINDKPRYQCPSNSLFTLISTSGEVFKCTDNRSKETGLIGQITDNNFEKFWHSNERVIRQLSTRCYNKGCVRSGINRTLLECYNSYIENGIDKTDSLICNFDKKGGYIFI